MRSKPPRKPGKDRRPFPPKPAFSAKPKPPQRGDRPAAPPRLAKPGRSENLLYGLHAVQAALANPRRKLGRAFLTPRAAQTIGEKLLARGPGAHAAYRPKIPVVVTASGRVAHRPAQASPSAHGPQVSAGIRR